jgi:3D (Asp-Asp-Asp) domain-containing protein
MIKNLFVSLLFVCPSLHATEMICTVTAYWSEGHGSDSYTSKKISATGEHLREGVSCAVDPRIFPYGTVLYIKGIGKRVAVDTGSAVIKRIASRRRGVSYPVVDIYFDSRADAIKFSNKYTYVTVKVIGRS